MSTLTYDGVTVEIPGASRYPQYIRDELANGTYERDEVRLIADHLSGGERVLELGSGLGFIGTYAKKRFPGVTWFSVDADPSMCMATMATHIKNHVDMPAPVFAVLLPTVGEVTRRFYVREEFTTSSLTRVELSYSPVVSVIDVPVRPLNAMISSLGIDTLVLDIEGGEVEVFTPELRLGVIETVLIELHPHFMGQDAIGVVDSVITGSGLTRVEYEDKGTGGFVACYQRR